MRCVLNQNYLTIFNSKSTVADSLEYLRKATSDFKNVAASVKLELLHILLFYSLNVGA